MTAPATMPGAPFSLVATTLGARWSPKDDPRLCDNAQRHATVWYRLRSTSARRLVLTLDAGGLRDAVIAVFALNRSQLAPVGCALDDGAGQANLPFQTRTNQTYLVVVAPTGNSPAGPFHLRLRAVAPATRPALAHALPASGVWGVLDPLLRLDAAWSATLETGVTYRLASWVFPGSSGECPDLQLFAAPVHSFAHPYRTLSCRGFLLFTPRPGMDGRWVIRVVTKQHVAPRFRYHLELAPAVTDDTAPGIPLGRHALVYGSVNATGVDRLDLYRFSTAHPSELFVRAIVKESAEADLVVMDDQGKQIVCACQGSGEESTRRRLEPGRYYVAVRARGANPVPYTLSLLTRDITSTSTTIDATRGSATVLPGQGATLDTSVMPVPRHGGVVLFTVDRFDPLAGWLFFRQATVSLSSAGHATWRLDPPQEGTYRVASEYLGTDTSAPSRGAATTLTEAAPLDP